MNVSKKLILSDGKGVSKCQDYAPRGGNRRQKSSTIRMLESEFGEEVESTHRLGRRTFRAFI